MTMAAPTLNTLVVAAVLACATFSPTAAAGPAAPAKPQECRQPAYPRDALKLREAGITVIGFLIGPEGDVRDTKLLASSGSPSLDRAAQESLSKCAFKPGTKGGVPVLSWFPVAYTWVLDDDKDMARVKAALAQALNRNKDDADALYRLSLLTTARAKTDADRAGALALLRRAAELGKPYAQFVLGRRYERGEGVTQDIDTALDWYEKAAAQGDVFAVDRLGFGELTY